MDYQIVLQFKGDSLGDYDSMVALENELIGALEGFAEVDGHDLGAGQTNIFLITLDPTPAFECAKTVLERLGELGGVAAAYRPLGGDAFTVLWPHHLQSFSVT